MVHTGRPNLRGNPTAWVIQDEARMFHEHSKVPVRIGAGTVVRHIVLRLSLVPISFYSLVRIDIPYRLTSRALSFALCHDTGLHSKFFQWGSDCRFDKRNQYI